MHLRSLKRLFNGLAAGLSLAAGVAAQVSPAPHTDTTPERMEKVVNDLRATKSGAALDDFAKRHQTTLSWQELHGGSQSSNRVTVNPTYEHELTVQILAHELRHVWQEFALRTQDMPQTPVGTYRLRTLREIDSCAFEAHIAAERADAAGYNRLSNVMHMTPSALIAESYASRPPATRDYLKHAILPCADNVATSPTYGQTHPDAAFETLKTARQANVLTGGTNGTVSPFLDFFHESVFITATPDENRRLYRSFFTASLDPREIIAPVARMDDAAFDVFIDKITAPGRHAKDLAAMQREFESLKKRTEKKLGQSPAS